MADHARKIIRDQAVAMLAADVSGAWKTVVNARIAPSRAIMPYLLVYSYTDTAKPMTVTTPPFLDREFSLMVVGQLKTPGNADFSSIEASMDDMAAKVEAILTTDEIIKTLPTVSITLESSAMEVLINEDETPHHAELTMKFTVSYRTVEGAPTTIV